MKRTYLLLCNLNRQQWMTAERQSEKAVSEFPPGARSRGAGMGTRADIFPPLSLCSSFLISCELYFPGSGFRPLFGWCRIWEQREVEEIHQTEIVTMQHKYVFTCNVNESLCCLRQGPGQKSRLHAEYECTQTPLLPTRVAGDQLKLMKLLGSMTKKDMKRLRIFSPEQGVNSTLYIDLKVAHEIWITAFFCALREAGVPWERKTLESEPLE